MPVNRWNDEEASRWSEKGELGQRVYSSRLLGGDPSLVLHGGGNTSVKSTFTTVFGENVDVLVVKGSGADLSEVDEDGFAWLRLDHVRRLAELDELSDTDMAEQMKAASVKGGGPSPSVEAILHAVLPFRFVDHTHADAVVTLTNTPRADELLAEAYGENVVVVPYVMPGFKLAREVARTPLPDGALGMILMNHGAFTWGETAREAYDRMIELVGRAEDRVGRRRTAPDAAPASPHRLERAQLRAALSRVAEAPMVMSSSTDAPVMAFVNRPDVGEITQRGPLTPEHVIRTKPRPLVGRDVDAYAAAYRDYFDRHASRSSGPLQPLDPAPRVVLDPELGMACAGRTPKDVRIAEDIYRHTMDAILDATALGGYQSISEADQFDVEYWDLEQAKLRRKGDPPPFAGEVALVTGAASGIGRACAEALMGQGAAVVGVDVNPEIKAFQGDQATQTGFNGLQWLGVEADVTDPLGVAHALDQAALRFGGLDILVLNAGIFPASAAIAETEVDEWRRVMAVNLDANLTLLRETHALLALSPRGGRVVVIGSKNVRAPGPGAAAYSASKAALTQLARVAALEWAADGIRVNVIHPNAVFDTGVWTDKVLADRAARYGLSVDEYRTNNLLGVEVTSADVAELCVAMCGPAFAKTTGAQVPVDGGNQRVV